MGLVQSILFDTGVAIFLISVCILIEQIAVIERYTLRQRVPGLVMNTVGTILSTGLSWPLQKLWGELGLAPAMILPLWNWLEPLGALGYAIQFLLLITIADFLAYWRHRAEHKWFWAIHVVHHSPTELHAANDIGHPVQIVFSLLFI